MDKDYSDQGVVKFLDYAADRGLINQVTAQSRKSAFLRIAEILQPEEKKNLKNLDFEDAFTRFQTRYPHAMTPDSFVTYKSRAKKALEDFLIWVENPAGFKASNPKKPKVVKPKQKDDDHKEATGEDGLQDESKSLSLSAQHLRVLIRGNILVQVSNLPFDLKQVEADRIKKLIDAHVLEEV